MPSPTTSLPKLSVPPSPGFLDHMKKSGAKFWKIDWIHKLATLALTVLVGIPTLGLGGVFAFMACSEYFASKIVKDISKNKNPLLTKIEHSFKNIISKDNLESSKINLDDIERMAVRLADLDDQVDDLNLDNKDAFNTMCKIRASLANERLALKITGPCKSDPIIPLIESIEGKLAVQEVKLLHMAEESKNEALISHAISFEIQLQDLIPFESKIESLSFESLDKVAEVSDTLEDIQRRIGLLENVLEGPAMDPTLKIEFETIKIRFQGLELKIVEKVRNNSNLIQLLIINERYSKENQDKLATSVLKMSGSFSDEAFQDLKDISLARVNAIRPRGIKNVGNSCWMNSTMQMFVGNEAIKQRIMSPNWPGLENDIKQVKVQATRQARDNPELVKKLNDLFAIWESTENLNGFLAQKYSEDEGEQVLIKEIFEQFYILKNLQITTQEFVRQLEHSKNPKDMVEIAWNLRSAIFATGIFGDEHIFSQEDASELALLILDKIGFKLPTKFTREVPAKQINHISEENLNLLPVAIEGCLEKNIQSLINNVFETEKVMDVKNPLYLNREYHPAHEVTFGLRGNPPDQVVLHLKRFDTELKKITDELTFPKDHILDFSRGYNAEEGSVRYRVTGAVHHQGSRDFAHYRGFTYKGGEWYEANDKTVSRVRNIDKELSTAYLLLLERV